MRGLIYKDISLFFKNIGKKEAFLVLILTVLLFIRAGNIAGLFVSILFSMAVGIQHILNFSADEQHDWKKYQLTLPVSNHQVVLSKYISVILTLSISLFMSFLFSVLTGIFVHHFDYDLLALSMVMAVIIPLIWTGIHLPFVYWFGLRSAQFIGVLIIFPYVRFLSYLEDGSGIMDFTVLTNMQILFIIVLGFFIFGLSYVLSLYGYARRK